ncbi:GNAT family N-acetyltransferase [Laceyella sacchari]|uniref:GNAT family N-acetyltransferase n=1 Tax=Laceyella sacchari TaxID=37482 RepID=UPI001FE5FBE9|nr:GNAT family N-acetyltransferase [Laceyella sacchari]
METSGVPFYDPVYVELGNIGTTVSRRRQGWGRIITTELTRRAREYSSDVYLYVFDDNVPAIRLYESLGYRLVSKLQRL